MMLGSWMLGCFYAWMVVMRGAAYVMIDAAILWLVGFRGFRGRGHDYYTYRLFLL